MDLNSNTAAVPIGDGIHDDTAAIQALLDTGASLVELPAPKVSYIISRTLLIGDGQELRLGRFTPVRLADGSNCPMLANRDPGGGNRHVAVSGGVWDMNNRGHRHNLSALCAMDKARRRSWLDERQEETQEAVVRWPEGRYSPDYFYGVCFRFHNVEDFVLRGVTIRNPTTYGIQLWKVRGFLVDDIEFDYRWGNPAKANMDGLHLDGFCRNGKISNLRGICFDDFVALNATDGLDSPGHGPIEDIDIDGIYCDYCHSAARLLSRSHADAIRRVTIRNAHGRYYSYGVGLTYFHRKVAERGLMDRISVIDCGLAKAGEPADCWLFDDFGVIEVEAGIDIGSLDIVRLSRDEDMRHEVDTIRVREGATISRLVLRDCEQINRTDCPMRFLHNRGEIGELVHENTRLVSAPGENILVDTETPIPPYARDWATMADIVARGMAHPARGAKRPDSEVAAGFGEGMIRVFPFVGEDANAFAGKIDEYGFTVQPGVCWCRYKNFPMRIEATASRAAAWFRIRFPEAGARSILADSALSVAFSEPVVAKEASGENTIYRFAPGGRPIVVQASRGSLAESETDFDRVANLARRAWNDVCR